MVWIGYAVVGGAILILLVGEYCIKKYHERSAKKFCKRLGIPYRKWDWF